MSYQESLDFPLVCADRYCPKVFDPQRNIVMCRCYQAQTTSPINPVQNSIPASVPGIGSSPPGFTGHLQYGENQTVPQYATSYPSYLGYGHGYDGYGMCQSIYSQLSPNMSTPDLSMYNSQQAMSYTQNAQMDHMLRSQVNDFWSYQQLSNQLNGSDIPATKQSTKMLKTWLREHRKNPYPTKTEKVMLAFATRMTMTQISNWFANARRRMKQQKEKGNSSDCALSDISDDDDKGSLCTSPAPVSALSSGTNNPLAKATLPSYLQEREQLLKSHQAVIKTTERQQITTEISESKTHTDSTAKSDDKTKQPVQSPKKSKIWKVQQK